MRRHRLDPLSLVAGLAFVALGAVSMVDAVGASVSQIRWIMAVMLIGFGAALMLPTRSRPKPSSTDDAESTPD
jgi:hypothetical protein